MFITDTEKIVCINSGGELKESIAPSELSEGVNFTLHEGKILLMGSGVASGSVYVAEVYDGSLSLKSCFKIPKNALSMASYRGYLWVFTPDSVLGYKENDCGFNEQIRLDGISPNGKTCNFFDELVFLTKSGVYSIFENEKIKLREISAAVNPMLISEDLSRANMCVWRGYLVISIDGRMYLADSRDRLKSGIINEYRWYYLNGIGTYRSDKRVYRYSEFATEGFSVHKRCGEIAEGEIMSFINEKHEKRYYVHSGDEKYEVYPTEEMSGGLFFPAVCICESENLLFFSTECGDLCLFNNDMRGRAPRGRVDFEKSKEKDENWSLNGKIHPYYYSFDHHAPRYAALTPRDKCDAPFCRKSDLYSSYSILLKSFPSSVVTVETRYDAGAFGIARRFSNSGFDFYNFDFQMAGASTEDYTTVNLPQSRVGWQEKQLSIYSNEYCSPFGILSIHFAYKMLKTKKHSKKG